MSWFDAAAKIGDSILLDHGTGLVIGETAVVGNHVSLMHVSHFVVILLWLSHENICLDMSETT